MLRNVNQHFLTSVFVSDSLFAALPNRSPARFFTFHFCLYPFFRTFVRTMTKKVIILDFDGTMADTRQLIVSTIQATLQELHLPMQPEKACAATIGLPLRKCFTSLMSMSDIMGSRCEETYRRIFFEKVTQQPVPMFPHVVDTVRQLRKDGYEVTIATSRSSGSLRNFLKNMGLTESVSFFLGADDVANPKPDPEPVLLTLQHFGCTAEEAIVVGDTTFDIEMGRNAGCQTCGVTYGNHSRRQLAAARADFIIDDFSQLIQIIHDLC